MKQRYHWLARAARFASVLWSAPDPTAFCGSIIVAEDGPDSGYKTLVPTKFSPCWEE
jgi:hypothetical protein